MARKRVEPPMQPPEAMARFTAHLATVHALPTPPTVVLLPLCRELVALINDTSPEAPTAQLAQRDLIVDLLHHSMVATLIAAHAIVDEPARIEALAIKQSQIDDCQETIKALRASCKEAEDTIKQLKIDANAVEEQKETLEAEVDRLNTEMPPFTIEEVCDLVGLPKWARSVNALQPAKRVEELFITLTNFVAEQNRQREFAVERLRTLVQALV